MIENNPKTQRTMKTMKNMRWMAALALTASMIMACSTEDDLTEIENPANQHKVLTLTTTISMSHKADTRSIMTDTGSGITAEWEVGDKFYVSYGDMFYVSKSAQAQVISINPTTKDATITVDLVDPSDGDWISFMYPYEEQKNYQYNGDIIQSGTLNDIKDHYTRISGGGELSVSGNTVSLPDGIEMEQRTAIWKLSFTDGTNDITKDITKLDISIGNYTTYQVAPSSLNVIYVALDDYETYGTKDYYFEATTATGVYAKSKSGISLEGGKVYTSTGVALSPTRDGNTVYLANLREYEAQDGEVLTGTARENAHIKVADGATITLSDADITAIDASHAWAGITCLGDATIILSGTNSIMGGFSLYPGIYVPADKTLTIKGNGQLTVNSNDGYNPGAGIGGGGNLECGNIIIKGGDITTTSGIGSGYSGTCGDITIEGGTINSTGKNYSPGIGGKCGNITISGGNITSTGIDSPGIGSVGGYGTSDVSCGNIVISGGSVTAIGNGLNAGIGGGSTTGSCCLDITISGSSTTVNATGGGDFFGGAGIGGGYQGTCGNITIEDGTIIATGGYGGAGIGGGYQGNCSNITIEDGTVTASGGYGGTGIGGGYQGNCSNITIEDGTIIATGGSSAAGIGGGYGSWDGDPCGTCGIITIEGGNVDTAGGYFSAAIGGGYYGNCGDVTITNTVTQINATMGSYSSTTIGKGSYSTCGTVTIGGTVYAEGITDSPYTYQP